MNQEPNRFDDLQREPAPPPPPAPRPAYVELPRAAPYVTYTIIAITILFFLLQQASNFVPVGNRPEDLLMKINEKIEAGELWRLLTPALLHGGLMHIVFNMYALFSFGVSLERHFGHGRFFLLYVLGAFAGNVASFVFSEAPSLGASTAIFGLLAAEGIFLVQNRRLFAGQFRSAIGNIIFIAAINLFVIGSLPGIDNWGHIGGLLGGLIFTLFAGPVWEIEGMAPALKLVDQRPAHQVLIGAMTVAILFGALAAWKIVT
jgi:rhomboid protease GluP